MSQTTIQPRTVFAFPRTPSRSTSSPDAVTPSGGLRRRLTQMTRRAFTPPEPRYWPRAVDTQPFERGPVEWRRAPMDMQRLT